MHTQHLGGIYWPRQVTQCLFAFLAALQGAPTMSSDDKAIAIGMSSLQIDPGENGMQVAA